MLGDTLDLGFGFVGIDPADPDLVLPIPQQLLRSAGVEPSPWWPTAIRLIAPVGLGAVFSKLAAASPPGYGVMAANVGVYSALFLAINMMRARLMFPDAAGQFGAQQMALWGFFALCSMVLLSFAWAGMLHAAVAAAGGQGGYQRSYQILSLLSVFWPALAAASTFHYGWLAVAAFWAYLAIAAAESLQQVPAQQAQLMLGGAALAGTAAVWFLSVQIDKYLTPYVEEVRMAAQMKRQMLDTQATMAFQQSLQGTLPAGAAPGAPDPSLQAQQLILQAQQMMQQTGGPIAPMGTSSGLQVLPPAGQTAATTPAQGVQQLKQTTEIARQAELNALTQVMPMINNPAMTKNLSPQQAQEMQQIAGVLSQLQNNVKTGKPLSPDQISQFQQMGQFTIQTMQQMKNQPPIQAQPQPQAQAPAQQGAQP